MKEHGIDNPTLTDNFSLDSSKKVEINSNALSTRCYLSRILPTPLVFISGYRNMENVFYCSNKKPKYAAIAKRRHVVIFDVVLTVFYRQKFEPK